MRTEQVTCDNCGRDLTTTTNCEAYRTVLQAERIPSTGGALTAMLDSPEPKRPHHFCGMHCVAAFIEKHRKVQRG